jgi:hypothetical protein
LLLVQCPARAAVDCHGRRQQQLAVPGAVAELSSQLLAAAVTGCARAPREVLADLQAYQSLAVLLLLLLWMILH